MLLTVFALMCLRAVNAEEVADLESLTTANVLELLKHWKLHHAFGPVFESQGYDGSILFFATKDDIDSEFPDVSPLHRRTLFERIQELQEQHMSVARRLTAGKKPDMKGYTGLRMHVPKSVLAFGEDEDITLFRDANGNLQIVANVINFQTTKITANGVPLKLPGSSPPPFALQAP